MKKLFLCIIVPFLCLISCNKATSDSKTPNIEGTWGLTHAERYVEINGEAVEDTNGNYNPFSPSTKEDCKWVIINTTGNKYSISFYYWFPKLQSWELSGNGREVSISGNILTNLDNQFSYPIEITEKTLSFEYTMDDIVDGGKYGKEGSVNRHVRVKQTLRKMGELGE